MNILILHSQVPFVRGGAEVLVQGLATELRTREHEVDIVALPLNWNPPERLLTTALAWRLVDLERFNDKRVDLVICTKFPTWAVAHPNKVLWLIHQHRQAYDLFGTPFSEFDSTDAHADVRKRVVEIDRRGIAECHRRFAISRNVSDRLRRYTGLDAEPLYPPVPRSGLVADRFDPFILSVARLDAAKRVDSLIDAWRQVDPSLHLRIVGDGPDRVALERRVRQIGMEDRITFLGRVDDESLRTLFNTCRAVYYAPLDEDYGFTAVEALSAAKPVVTSPDSGGVLEFVSHEHTGIITSLDPDSLARAINRLSNPTVARQLGANGPALTKSLTWENIVRKLVGN